MLSFSFLKGKHVVYNQIWKIFIALLISQVLFITVIFPSITVDRLHHQQQQHEQPDRRRLTEKDNARAGKEGVVTIAVEHQRTRNNGTNQNEYGINHTQQYRSRLRNDWFAFSGIVHDGSIVTDNVINFLVQVTCDYQVPTFILVRDNAHILLENYEKFIKRKDRKLKVRHQYQTKYGNANSTMSSSSAPSSFGSCSKFLFVKTQPQSISVVSNRVDRIALARDFIRDEMREHFFLQRDQQQQELEQGKMQHMNPPSPLAIAVADLDLLELPSPKIVLQHAWAMSYHANDHRRQSDVDVMCAAGVVKDEDSGDYDQTAEAKSLSMSTTMERTDEAYYDTFATILLPDTFVYPIHKRLFPTLRHQDDPSRVISDKYSRKDLLEWFKNQPNHQDRQEKQSQEANGNEGRDTKAPSTQRLAPVKVRSCFGGLAIYRANVWFHPGCRYHHNSTYANDDDYYPSSLALNYANARDERVCEHVVFHECLRRRHHQHFATSDDDNAEYRDIGIFVQPDLRTQWSKRLQGLRG